MMRKRHEDLTAWDMTIKGLWHLHRATQHDFSEALALLEDATRVDPGFALPWSVIAQARFEQALKGWKGGRVVGAREALRGVLEAASISVELDPASWMGHALMGAAELWTNLSVPRARLHAEKAIELNPSASMAHHFSGCISGFAGDLKGAIETQNNVYRVDPRYGHAEVVEADLGLWHLLEGDLERAAEHLQRSIGVDPSNLRARQRQIVLAGLAGDAALAREAFRALEELGGTMDEQYLAASYPFQDREARRDVPRGTPGGGEAALQSLSRPPAEALEQLPLSPAGLRTPCLPRGDRHRLLSETDMSKPADLVQGTLDLLLLKILALEPLNGWAISLRLRAISGGVLQVSEGSLYPALHKLEQEGWITAEWKQTENNRRAKFYSLTRLGRRELESEKANWHRLSTAISHVVQLSEA